MKHLAKLFDTPLKVILLLVIGWVICANLFFGINLPRTAITIFLVIVFAVVARGFLKKRPQRLAKLKALVARKWFYILVMTVVAVVGTVARLSFLQYEYSPTYDPATFYYNAQSIAETGELRERAFDTANADIGDQIYFATYPYEMNYTGLLAISNLVFGGGLLSVIMLNLILDMVAGVLAFLIVRRLAPERKWLPVLAGAMVFLNPFNVVFSALSLPIVAVNTLILLVIYIVVRIVQKSPANYKIWQLFALFAMLGIIMGIGNGFRPIFTVVLIAVVLLVAYLFIAKNIRGRSVMVSTAGAVVLMLVSFFATTQLNFAVVDHYAGMPVARNASGWALYVGSNIESSGKWGNQADIAVRHELWEKYPSDAQAVHDELTVLAKERYAKNGLMGNIGLYINKAFVAGGDQSSSMYNTSGLAGYIHTLAYEITKEIAEVFILVLCVMIIINVVRNWGRGSLAVWILLALIVIGFFAGGLFVEVKNRYFTIFLPAMILLATYCLRKLVAGDKT